MPGTLGAGKGGIYALGNLMHRCVLAPAQQLQVQGLDLECLQEDGPPPCPRAPPSSRDSAFKSAIPIKPNIEAAVPTISMAMSPSQ